MKLLRETIRKLILENSDELLHMLAMSKSNFAYYQQAKTLASALGMEEDLEQEFLNLIKQTHVSHPRLEFSIVIIVSLRIPFSNPRYN